MPLRLERRIMRWVAPRVMTGSDAMVLESRYFYPTETPPVKESFGGQKVLRRNEAPTTNAQSTGLALSGQGKPQNPRELSTTLVPARRICRPLRLDHRHEQDPGGKEHFRSNLQ